MTILPFEGELAAQTPCVAPSPEDGCCHAAAGIECCLVAADGDVRSVMLGAEVVEGAVGNCVDIFLFGLFHAGHVVKYIFVGVDCVEQCCVLGYHGAAQLVVYLLYLMAVVGLLLHRAVKV